MWTHRSARVALVVGVAVAALAGCGDPDPTDSATPDGVEDASGEIRGLWLFEAWEKDGVESRVEVGKNAAVLPWIEIGDMLKGSAGCNDFFGEYALVDGLLSPGEVMISASWCGGPDAGADLMATEHIHSEVIGHPAGIEVDATDTTMTWTAGNVRITYVRVDALPPPPTRPPATEIGLLDCSPGFLVEQRITGDDLDPEQMLADAAPTVMRVEHEPPIWWWGYDPDEQIVAGVAKGDIIPVEYQVFTCSE